MDKSNETTHALTPARLNVGRAGQRPTTRAWLEFRADHASARDAVKAELSDKFVQAMKDCHSCVCIQSTCSDRQDFVLYPPKGKVCQPADFEKLKSECILKPDVQIIISDGLSPRAVEVNVPRLLPLLLDGLEMAHFSYGTIIVARYARVAIGDLIAETLGARLVINLIGERPGLSSAESLSSYMTYNPGKHTISSDRTVVSNIHDAGTPALEAGAYIVYLVKKIFSHNLSGVRLQQADRG